VPDAASAFGILPIEFDEFCGGSRNGFLDNYLAILGIHNAETVTVFAVDIGEESVGEDYVFGLFNEQAHIPLSPWLGSDLVLL
jgi:hypothetical protein